MHGRVRPYNKWLEWELEHHPLPTSVGRCHRRAGARRRMATRGLALFLVALALAGCGRTYSAQDTARSFTAAGIPAHLESSGLLGQLNLFEPQCGKPYAFPPLTFVIFSGTFGYGSEIEDQLDFRHGHVIVFCGRYDAERFQQVLLRLPKGTSLEPRSFGRFVARRANLALFESVPDRRVEAVFSHFH